MDIIKTIFILLLLFCNIMYCTCPWVESLKKLREKVKKVKGDVKVVTESKRGPSLMFTPRSDILYPGLNMEKTAKVRKLWQDYYDCQLALYETSQRLIVPEAIASQQGTTAVLECEVCESPRDMYLPMEWFYSIENDMHNIVAVNLTYTVTMENDNLHLYNIQEHQAGLYVCRKGNHSARPYIVHVFYNESSKSVVPANNPAGEQPEADKLLPELGVTLTTRWAAWTQCNRCDQVGKRYRHGICTVLSNSGSRRRRRTYLPPFFKNDTLQLSKDSIKDVSMGDMLQESLPVKNLKGEVDNITQNQTTNSKGEVGNITQTQTPSVLVENTTEKQTTSSETLKYQEVISSTEHTHINMTLKQDLEILSFFEDGIPCRSKLLSEHIRNLEAVAKRKSEVMVSYCKLACPKSVMFVVVNEKRQILETANNSDGMYSVRQGLPHVLPTISRSVEFAAYNKYFTIQCPDVRDGDIPVVWFIKRKALTNKLLEKETKGRIRIDEYNRIIFNPALHEDSRVYSCWQHKDLVGTVRLKVESKHEFHYEGVISGVGLLGVFGVIFWVYYQTFIHS